MSRKTPQACGSGPGSPGGVGEHTQRLHPHRRRSRIFPLSPLKQSSLGERWVSLAGEVWLRTLSHVVRHMTCQALFY